MRSFSREVTERKLYYISNDNCFGSFIETEVEEYENSVNRGKPELITETSFISEYSEEYNCSWKIYKCNNKDDYTKMISLTANVFTDKSDIKSNLKKYLPEEQYYGITILPSIGDGRDELLITTAKELLQDYNDEIEETLNRLNKWKASKEKILKILQ